MDEWSSVKTFHRHLASRCFPCPHRLSSPASTHTVVLSTRSIHRFTSFSMPLCLPTQSGVAPSSRFSPSPPTASPCFTPFSFIPTWPSRCLHAERSGASTVFLVAKHRTDMTFSTNPERERGNPVLLHRFTPFSHRFPSHSTVFRRFSPLIVDFYHRNAPFYHYFGAEHAADPSSTHRVRARAR